MLEPVVKASAKVTSPKILACKETNIIGHFEERSGQGRQGERCYSFGLPRLIWASPHYNAWLQSPNQYGSQLAINGKKRIQIRQRNQAVLVGNPVSGKHHLHVLGYTFRIGGKP